MKIRLSFLSLFISATIFSQPALSVEEFITGIPYGPLGLVNCGDERLFIICQDGYILIADSLGNLYPEPFLDIDASVESDFNAHGLLGAVFHPDYATNGYFYVNYINNDMNSVIARFTVSAGDPDLANVLSEEILLTVEQPYTVHKAGDMHFGPDGFLYFPFGDGGVATGGGPGDPDNRAQNPQTYLGKMLRIDVNGAMPYEIPASNPFFGAVDTLNEIWAIGLRNPWRFSFDRLTGDMWLPDVGHDLWEEINFETAGFAGGNNYGWRCYEGNAEYNFDSCDVTGDYTFPIYDYPHNDSTGGYSVTGGYVYRGTDFPGLFAKYIYCDYVTGNFYTLEPGGPGGWTNHIYLHLLENVVSFGEDQNGEMFCVVRADGSVHRIKDLCASLALTAITENENCGIYTDGAIELFPDGGNDPYSFNWSNGDTTQIIDSLIAGVYYITIIDSIGCILTDTFEVQLDGLFEVSIYAIDAAAFATPDDAVSYQWYLNGEPIDGAVYSSTSIFENGYYSVEVTDDNGCTVMSDELFFSTGIQDITINQLLIFPNPASEFILLENLNVRVDQLEIVNPVGELVYSGSQVGSEIDISQLPNGIYQLRVIAGNQILSGQFAIAR